MWSLFIAFLFSGQIDSSIHLAPIYGDDSRRDLYEVHDPEQLRAAQLTAALFFHQKVVFSPDSEMVNLKTKLHSKRYQLCEREPFENQNSGSFCSGFLLTDDLLLTAQHCIPSLLRCRSTKFVFGFSETDYPPANSAQGTLVSKENVFECKELLQDPLFSGPEDPVLVRLDRKVSHFSSFPWSDSAEPETSVFTVGHPSGLPTKIAQGEILALSPHGDKYITNLDTYAGNSGGPVFNAETHELIGFVSSGEDDYIRDGNCYRSRVCSPQECKGETVTSLSHVHTLIQNAE